MEKGKNPDKTGKDKIGVDFDIADKDKVTPELVKEYVKEENCNPRSDSE